MWRVGTGGFLYAENAACNLSTLDVDGNVGVAVVADEKEAQKES